NHFPLDESASRTLLMGGGIGVTPMIAMAHRLHAIGAEFTLHYSAKSRAAAGFLDDLAAAPWAGRVHYHFSDEGTRIDLAAALGRHQDGSALYVCGPDRYMDAVLTAGAALGWPEEAMKREYFSVPEQPEWENHPFTLRLKEGREVEVAADEAATDALLRLGIRIDVKCSDGICGVCKCGVRSGAVEHRDFVLGPKQRETSMILCSSRAAEPDGVIELDL
ncbi:MAG: PDR/VanB family oxidoreductase, partial [Pseudomonadota bacterium]